VAAGDEIIVAASGRTTRVKRIVTADGDQAAAEAEVTLTLEDEIDVGRGDVLAKPTERPEVADQFAAHLIWMDGDQMDPGRNYIFRIGTQSVSGSITTIKHRIDVNTRDRARYVKTSSPFDRALADSFIVPAQKNWVRSAKSLKFINLSVHLSKYSPFS
jgi:sulfate adenylyltransferase subunit 1 (EFTu-like GTPase family)